MLTEAASTGKPVFTLPMQGKPGKFEQLYKSLYERCNIRPFDGILTSENYPPLEETQRIAEQLWAHYFISLILMTHRGIDRARLIIAMTSRPNYGVVFWLRPHAKVRNITPNIIDRTIRRYSTPQLAHPEIGGQRGGS